MSPIPILSLFYLTSIVQGSDFSWRTILGYCARYGSRTWKWYIIFHSKFQLMTFCRNPLWQQLQASPPLFSLIIYCDRVTYLKQWRVFFYQKVQEKSIPLCVCIYEKNIQVGTCSLILFACKGCKPLDLTFLRSIQLLYTYYLPMNMQ